MHYEAVSDRVNGVHRISAGTFEPEADDARLVMKSLKRGPIEARAIFRLACRFRGTVA